VSNNPETLFMVTAQVRKVEVGLYADTETTLSVIHPVQAQTESQAHSLLAQHYEALSKTDSPYGTRYTVTESQAFPLISAATLAVPPA
jgi:hypothetical protein